MIPHWPCAPAAPPATLVDTTLREKQSTFTMAQNPIFGILWLALLVFIAWPVAGIGECASLTRMHSQMASRAAVIEFAFEWQLTNVFLYSFTTHYMYSHVVSFTLIKYQ